MNLRDAFSDHVLARIAKPLRHVMEAVNSQPFYVDHEVAVEVTREMKVEVNRAQHEVDVARLAKILKTRQMKGANIRWPAVQPRVDPFQTIHVRGCMSADEIWSVTLGNWFCPVKFEENGQSALYHLASQGQVVWFFWETERQGRFAARLIKDADAIADLLIKGWSGGKVRYHIQKCDETVFVPYNRAFCWVAIPNNESPLMFMAG